jgi:hypothetical protein
LTTIEHERLSSAGAPEGPLSEAGPWNRWGPYLSERAWGTVREDYSPDGSAWDFFPHDDARSRAYRWNEDGMAGISDIFQRLCLSLALWNGRDPIIKERMFGLAGPEGNHGEDAKDYWWYLDALPSHALLRWRYHYPQQAFPYEDLVKTNAARGKLDPEYELLDTGVFDGGTWIVEVTFAKVEPTDMLMRITVRNAGTATERVHVLPHLWFRNTWDWEPGSPKPAIGMDGDDLLAEHPTLGRYRLQAAHGPHGAPPTPLFCENETNAPRVYEAPATTPYPKDGINDHLITGSGTVNPDLMGTKAALWYVADIAPGDTAVFDLRLRDDGEPDALGALWSGDVATATIHERQVEADEFYATIEPEGATADEALVMRQGFAGMIWSKQFYPYDVSRWLDGDPGRPPPPEQRTHGRNADWRHVQANDVLSMPDPWEYPWFAAWDLAFHTVVLAHVDPAFAKYQLIALTREWFMHPNGALPAYEWSFDDVNPPVHAWAAWRVFQIDGSQDHAFLARIFHKLLINFTWWVNRQDAEGNNLFEGGFLGLDNIGPFDRSHMPVPGNLEQSDGTGWMAAYCLAMLGISLELSRKDPSYDTLITKFLEHFAQIASAMNQQGLWDEEDGFFYDRLSEPDGTTVAMRYRSIVGVMPVLASAGIATGQAGAVMNFRKRFAASVERQRGERARLDTVGQIRTGVDGDHVLLSVVSPDQLRRLLTEVLDEGSLLSPFGLRSISRRHLEHPFTVEVEGVTATVDYEPGESTSGMFGGNSNWRGPVWFPVNHLILEALERYHAFVGEDYTVECPTGSGRMMTLRQVADELRRRLISIFLPGPDGRRPLYGAIERYATDPDWQGLIEFHEYFHGDTGFGIGASHQTGWTGLVAHLIASGGGDAVGTARFGKTRSARETEAGPAGT